MADFIIVAILLLIVGAAVRYIVKSKKSGAKCIGCPTGGCTPVKAQKKVLKKISGTKELEIKGMHCEGCKVSLEKALNALDGVSATVNLKKQTVKVSYEKEVSEELLRETVMKAGFAVIRIS